MSIPMRQSHQSGHDEPHNKEGVGCLCVELEHVETMRMVV